MKNRKSGCGLVNVQISSHCNAISDRVKYFSRRGLIHILIIRSPIIEASIDKKNVVLIRSVFLFNLNVLNIIPEMLIRIKTENIIYRKIIQL